MNGLLKQINNDEQLVSQLTLTPKMQQDFKTPFSVFRPMSLPALNAPRAIW